MRMTKKIALIYKTIIIKKLILTVTPVSFRGQFIS